MTISFCWKTGCTEMQREVPATLPCQPVCLPEDTHQALAPWSSIRSSAGSTLTLVTMEFFSKVSAVTCWLCCRHMLITGARQRRSEEKRIHQGQAAVRRAGPFQGRLRRCRAPVINTWRQHDQQVTNRPTRLDHLDPRPASSCFGRWWRKLWRRTP